MLRGHVYFRFADLNQIRLQSKEDAIAEEAVQEQPLGRQAPGFQNDATPVATEPCSTTQEEGCHLVKINEPRCDVDRDGVHANHRPEERPSLPANHVYDCVEETQQQQAPTASDEHK